MHQQQQQEEMRGRAGQTNSDTRCCRYGTGTAHVYSSKPRLFVTSLCQLLVLLLLLLVACPAVQVSGLPHIHNAQLVCLPALQVWSFVLGHESPASAARFTAAGGGSGSLSRASTVADAAEAAAAADVAAADVAAALAAVTGDEAVTGGDRPDLPSCVVQACQQLLLQTACSCLLWAQSAEGWEAAGTLEASAAVHDLFLAVCCVLGQQQYLQHILHVWGQQPQQQQQQPQELSLGRPALQQVLQCIAAAPPALRLHVAVEMAAAAAAVVQPGDGDTAAAVSSHADMQQVGTCQAGLKFGCLRPAFVSCAALCHCHLA